MKWPMALLFSALLLAGCYGPQYQFDPFLGRTRVIPPGTGQVAPGAIQPYYQGSPMPAPGSSIAPPYTPSPAPPAGSVPYNNSGFPPIQNGASNSPAIRTNRGVVNLDSQAQTAWSRPRGPWTSDGRVVSRPQPIEEQIAVQQASYESPSPAKVALNRPPAKYGYDTDYGSLQGRLEYLESQQQWKLRYIPIDGDTDRYGGSVIIADTSALADYQPGDFVTVQGTIDKPSGTSRSFAPTYRVASVKSAGLK